jgi:hypothetical protein
MSVVFFAKLASVPKTSCSWGYLRLLIAISKLSPQKVGQNRLGFRAFHLSAFFAWLNCRFSGLVDLGRRPAQPPVDAVEAMSLRAARKRRAPTLS